MKMIVIIQKSWKQTCENKQKTNKIIYILLYFLWAEDRWANWADRRTENVYKSEESVRECAPFTSLSPNTQTKCYTDTPEVLDQRRCIASTPQLNRVSGCHSLGLRPWLLLLLLLLRATAAVAGARVRKGGSCRGAALRHYVVLIRLSSCLMAGKRKNIGTTLVWLFRF